MFNFDEIVDRVNSPSGKWRFPNNYLPNYVNEAPLPLWVADMDFKSPPCVLNALHEAISHGVFGYGTYEQSVMDAIVGWQKRYFNWDIHSEWIVQTPGIVTAISLIIQSFSIPGDHVMIQSPVYGPFHMCPENNGRYVIEAHLTEKNDHYVFDPETFERAIKPNTKIFILCNPHNPTGNIFTKEELTQMGEICLKHGILVVSDEIHQDLILNPLKTHIPYASIGDDFAQNSITCTAPSKTFNLAGLQTSNLIIPNRKIREQLSRTLTQTAVFPPNILGQIACKVAYSEGHDWLIELKNYLRGNQNYIQNFIQNEIPEINLYKSDALYLAWLDFRKFGYFGDDLHKKLLNEAGVWLDAGLKFGESGSGFARLNFGCPRITIENALSKIKIAFHK